MRYALETLWEIVMFFVKLVTCIPVIGILVVLRSLDLDFYADCFEDWWMNL